MPVNAKGAGKGRRSSSLSGTVKQHVKGENFYRNAAKAKRVKLLSKDGGKAIRDRDGNIIKPAAFQSSDAPSGRVQPDRRWFGNTRVISQKALDHFRTSLAEKQADPYSVILKQNKLPMSLLEVDVGKAAQGSRGGNVDLVTAEPFEQTFGPKQRRKRPRLDVAGSFEELVQEANKLSATKKAKSLGGEKLPPVDGLGQLVEGDDGLQTSEDLQGDGLHDAPSDYILSAGTSKRIWSELYKVIDSSDVILHVLDARDPLGTRCLSVENYMAKEKRGKKLVWILNKVDLVPGWVAARWVKYLSAIHPTIAFHASINNSFGKGSLIQVLRQFSSLFSDRKQISVGFVGYPNVGKSSIINTLKKRKVCNVAPIPGETKVWQYITLMRRIYLIDCPGIVPPSAKDNEATKVLKGVVRVEHLSCPMDHIPALLERIRPEYITRTYGIKGWTDSEDFLTQLARKSGRLQKGGEPDLRTIATSILNDWIRGKIPYFVPPPAHTHAQVPAVHGSTERQEAEVPSKSRVELTEKHEEEVPSSRQVNPRKKVKNSEVDKVGAIKGITQPLHQIIRSNKFIDEDNVAAEEHSRVSIHTAQKPCTLESLGSDASNQEELSDSEQWSGVDSESDQNREEGESLRSGSENERSLCFEDLVAEAMATAGNAQVPGVPHSQGEAKSGSSDSEVDIVLE